eukprot:UN2870
MLTQGVPIVYYGTEEYFTWQRESFWTYGYNTSTYMFKVLKTFNHLGKDKVLALSGMQVKIGQHATSKFVFTRGGDHKVWIFLNNMEESDHPVSYWGVLPPQHGKWGDVLTGEPAHFSGECFIAKDTYPKVLPLPLNP